MELTSLQKEKVDELVELYNPILKKKVDFKAPTGSGKTFMAVSFISNLILSNPNDNFVFVIATPSSSELPYSFEQKILQYKKDLEFSSFDVEHIESPSDNKKSNKEERTNKIIPEKNKVFIFGKSSFGKDRILTTSHVIDDFVSIIIDKGYKLIYIRDEAHIGGRINNDESFEALMQNNASLVIKMTATPDYRNQDISKVILSEEDLNNPNKNDGRYLLKTTPVSLLNGQMTDEDLLDNAIKEFKRIKKEYEKLDITICPALLVQVDNEPSNDKQKKDNFFNTLELIKKKFDKNNIKWAQYFGNNDKDSNTIYKDKFSLDEISKNDSDFDAIIFKIGPATGWDIPRACMLLQLRNVCSEGFNIQTIGRIKRNCYKGLEKNVVTDKYYIYSNNPQDNNIALFEAKVKDKFLNEEFISVLITNEKMLSKSSANKKLEKDINDFLTINKNKIIQKAKELIETKEDNIFYKDIHITTNSGQYISEISNVFQFIKLYNKIVNDNKNIFELCNKSFSNFWNNNYKNTKFKKYQFTKELFYITLMASYRNDIINLINKNRNYVPKYQVVRSPYDPNNYTEIRNPSDHDMETMFDAYLFNTKYNNSIAQPIGENERSPEVFVFRKIREIDYSNNKIKVWGKNFTTSNVNGAYIDRYNNVRRSFFDYIIKFNNGAFLYIEVKGEKDINKEKTEMLRGAYAEYFDRKQTTLFDVPLVLSIFKVNTKNGNITQESFYDKRFFSKDLNTLSVEELMEEISSK